MVTPEALRAVKKRGAVATNFYPDTSILDHGTLIPRALPLYDWVFTTIYQIGPNWSLHECVSESVFVDGRKP
jgi:hypothetical protein